MSKQGSAVRLDPAAKEAILELQIPGESDIYVHLVDVFLRSSDGFIAQIKQQLRDHSVVKKVAHSWRSSCAAMGAKQLEDICLQLEICDEIDRLPALIARAEQEYAAVRLALQSGLATA